MSNAKHNEAPDPDGECVKAELAQAFAELGVPERVADAVVVSRAAAGRREPAAFDVFVVVRQCTPAVMGAIARLEGLLRERLSVCGVFIEAVYWRL